MFDWVKKLLGSSNDAEVKKLQKNAVNAEEPSKMNTRR